MPLRNGLVMLPVCRRVRLLAILLLALPLAGCLNTDSTDQTAPTVVPPTPALSFLAPADLVCPDYITYQQGCGSFGEPQLEVAADGTIWYSAVCCIGQSPPIWRSHDGGLTFQALPIADGTGTSRDAFGIEGDFAIDTAGNVYFFDISAASSYFTKYTADGTHVFTKADPFPPIVDRPWVRAGAEDEVFIAYNSGLATWFFRSTDGGLTWDFANAAQFRCGLGGLGQGFDRNHLTIAACNTVWESFDGGLTWDAGTPYGGDSVHSGPHPTAYADDNEIVYLPQILANGDNRVLAVATAVETVEIGPKNGLANYPWLAAGRPGHVAVAYYAAENVTKPDEADAEWYLRVAYTTDFPNNWTFVTPQAEPVHKGLLGRNLGDFLQLRFAENGDLVIAYASRDGELQNRFVRSTGLDMGHAEFRNG